MVPNRLFPIKDDFLTWTSLGCSLENDLVNSGQFVRFRIPKCSLEEMFQTGSNTTVASVDQHGQVLSDDRRRRAVVELQKKNVDV